MARPDNQKLFQDLFRFLVALFRHIAETLAVNLFLLGLPL